MSESIAQERPRYDETFQREAVNHWLSSGKPAYVVAQELGIRLHQLYVWRKRYGPAAPGGRAVKFTIRTRFVRTQVHNKKNPTEISRRHFVCRAFRRIKNSER
jgi:transposase-like protein